ncbi:hypothetical protein I4U23_005556 [Adineta vaga]|nr:hypothetical protein I4U23_005556 [Adineta vaga]
MSSECLNGGLLILSNSSNTSYCQCHPCFEGINCSYPIPNKRRIPFNKEYVYLIIFLAKLCLSLVNNLLSLEVFLGCKRVRRTNIGVYLILYSIISMIGSVLLAVNQSMQYFKPYSFRKNQELSETFDCFLKKSGDQVAALVCLSLSTLVVFERALITCFNFKMNATRWRSVITLLLTFSITTLTSVAMLIYRCEFVPSHNTPTSRGTYRWFHGAGFLAGLIYVIGTLLVLIHFAQHIYHYGTVQESRKKNFFKVLRKHLFIFVPLIVVFLCVIPYQTWYSIRPFGRGYWYCGISTVEYIIKIIIQALPYIPIDLTWLMFVYPSNVYMTEFYTNTWSGRRIRKILDFGRFCKNYLMKGVNRRRNKILTVNFRDNYCLSS